MKYVVLCPDGAADWPLPALDNRTPLEAAHAPNLARMAAGGLVGLTQHAVEPAGNGSDVCCMSLLGFDPLKYHTGRAPLEAKSLGVELNPDEVAVRCNTVTIEDGLMVDYSAGHIPTEESKRLIDDLQKVLGSEGRHFYAGVQYRHLLVLRRPEGLNASCTPPHNIIGREIESHLPQGPDAPPLLELMEASKKLFAEHPVNRERIKRRENPVTQIWLWGHGPRPKLPAFRDVYGLDGAMISAVDLLRSLGLYLGLEVLNVPGITGFTDTDYGAKLRYALEALKAKDLVFVHVEAPDECGHMGDAAGKREALERIDAEIVGPLLESEPARAGNLRVLVCPDHSTPCALRTHATEKIPFLAWGPGFAPAGLGFTESDARRTKADVAPGYELLGRFLRGAL
ncbi:MAG: cofactor-independent phosphoglycerate mutase [Planctomycetota bacterium]|nr:cofactor-independent phosphoglycerate mutase [Planctomycetota bacterium]